MSEILKFTFKGNRDYIQGTSLFNGLVQAAQERGFVEGRINVSFKKMVHNSVCLLSEGVAGADDSVVARIVGQNEEQLALSIREATETEEASRQEFNEAEVCRDAVVGDKTIVQNRPHHHDKIELLVSLCKKMHQECVDRDKKWVFSRYDGQFPLPEPDHIELKITKQIGTRLTCSDVLVDGRKIGQIYFS